MTNIRIKKGYMNRETKLIMTKVKIYDNQQLSELENNINDFLKKKEVKQLIDIKYTAFSRDGVDKFSTLIIYQEDLNIGKEDPQMYE
ncbi:sporulation protein Cse60 [Candidatus Nitrosocosmicus sp. SS]|jgi:predicted ATP-grasp superfamily ATP-dependent carboligase|nr:sporulation protein Cse60 [Candidatus Nitrosocosmicus sp. SS]KAF0869969.1 sporulation protein Cse60 [Candidatus Nitrosocosmicus sp. SS]